MSGLSTKWIEHGIQLLFPPACVFCQEGIPNGQSCCDACARNIQLTSPYTCHRCGLPLADELAPGPCGRCLTRPPPQEETISLYTYHGPVREAILTWKLAGRDSGLLWLLDAARPRLKELIRAGDMLLPVPMPLKRMRKNGQHHAADLCHHIACITESGWEWRILRRQGEQSRQSSLNSTARWRNLRGAFAVNMKEWKKLPTPDRIWIVDDIHTTGATLLFAARALKSLKRPVHALSLARVAHRR